MPNKVFIDTSGWAELFVASESYHQQAREWFVKYRKHSIIEIIVTPTTS